MVQFQVVQLPSSFVWASQEAVLQRSSGSFGWLCQLWPLEASKVGGTSQRKLAKIRPSEVDRGVENQQFRPL